MLAIPALVHLGAMLILKDGIHALIATSSWWYVSCYGLNKDNSLILIYLFISVLAHLR